MKATLLYRIASILLVVIAAGNTYSLLRFWQVVRSMDPISFPLGHTGITYTQVVVTLELFCSLCVLFGAYLAWHLGGVARTTPKAIGALGWILFAYQLAAVYTSFICLSGPVRILAAAIAVCTGWANWLTTTHRQGQQQQGEQVLGEKPWSAR
jgi:hypothetical protein